MAVGGYIRPVLLPGRPPLSYYVYRLRGNAKMGVNLVMFIKKTSGSYGISNIVARAGEEHNSLRLFPRADRVIIRLGCVYLLVETFITYRVCKLIAQWKPLPQVISLHSVASGKSQSSRANRGIYNRTHATSASHVHKLTDWNSRDRDWTNFYMDLPT